MGEIGRQNPRRLKRWGTTPQSKLSSWAMADRPLRRLLWVLALASPAAILACVGDSPAPQTTPDASVDAAPLVDASNVKDTGVGDTGVDAGPCSNAIPGNIIAMPTLGSNLIPQGGGPLLAGDYVLTQARADCFPCDLKTGSAVGGIHVSVSGSTYTIERRLTIQLGGQPQVQVLDRWSGTYDQLNAKMGMSEQCPGSGNPTTWQAYLPVSTDGGADFMFMRFGTELRTQRTDGGVDAGPTLTWTFTRK